MALAGDHHVIVAVIAHLAGPPRGPGGQRAGHGQRIALAFLAAKAAAHPAHLDAHRTHRQMQGMGHLVLHLGRMLGRGMNDHVTPLLRQGQGDLAFQVEVLLAAHLDLPVDPMGGGGDGGGGIALGPDHGACLKPAVGGQRLIHRQQGGVFGEADLAHPGRPARGKVALGNHKENLLPQVMHRARGQQRLVIGRGRTVGHVRQIVGGQHRDNPGGRPDCGQVHAGDRAMRDAGQTKGQMQRACGRRDVVDIARLPGDMQGCGIMGKRPTHTHARTSSTRTGWPDISAA